ncbi:MAG TPA: glycosyltransferase [Candidatus Acidoferrum sp.]|nr:glycosyltransferase [Candidatus Acidoferrum sp.]
MRILNVTQSYAPFFEFGGPPVKVRALSEGLAARGHVVTVLTADWGLDRRLQQLPNEPHAEHDPVGRERKIAGVTAIYLGNWLHYRTASWNPALPRFLRAQLQEFEVVHIFGLYDMLGPRVAAACREKKIPYVVEPIGMFVPRVRNLWLKRVYHRFLGREMLAGASAIVATAEQEKSELIAGGIPKEKIVLRRNGVEGPPVLPEHGRFREAMGIPREAKLLLFLGRLSEKKSPYLLLQAFAKIAAAETRGQPPVHLVFVGPDEAGMLAKLKKMATSMAPPGHVHFSPALADTAKWQAYRDADIFVLPSQNENFGNTAAEAVAAGTPVVVTDQCGIAPLLGGVAGLVVKHDESALTIGIQELLHDETLYARLQAGCATVLDALNWDQPIGQMVNVYAALAGHSDS